jgi:hypothetical protein
VYTDAVCADCVLFEATVTAGSANVQCDRYTELLANLGTDAAVDFATVDSFALHCPHLIDSWDDVLPEREDEDEEEVGYVSDGDLTTDDYLKAMYIEAMEKREE